MSDHDQDELLRRARAAAKTHNFASGQTGTAFVNGFLHAAQGKHQPYGGKLTKRAYEAGHAAHGSSPYHLPRRST